MTNKKIQNIIGLIIIGIMVSIVTMLILEKQPTASEQEIINKFETIYTSPDKNHIHPALKFQQILNHNRWKRPYTNIPPFCDCADHIIKMLDTNFPDWRYKFPEFKEDLLRCRTQ